MKLFARSMSEAGLPAFEVTGGHFAKPQAMGWHITDDSGLTVGVANDSILRDVFELLDLLRQADAAYHFLERYGDGYMQVGAYEVREENFQRLIELLERFDIKS